MGSPTGPGHFDLVTANILARPLRRLAPSLARVLAPGGTLILSGLLLRDVPGILSAYAAQGLRLRVRGELEGWGHARAEGVGVADELPASRRLERMRAAPRAGWSIDDVVASAGSTRSAASHLGGGGSHYRVAHPAMPQKLTIPVQNGRSSRCVYSSARRLPRSRQEPAMTALRYPRRRAAALHRRWRWLQRDCSRPARLHVGRRHARGRPGERRGRDRRVDRCCARPRSSGAGALVRAVRRPRFAGPKRPDRPMTRFQSFDDPASSLNGTVRVPLLRAELARRGLDGFVVPRSDEHQSEYVPANAERLSWLTGFTGSAGTAIVLAHTAAIVVDGRYTLQAATQVDTALITPVPLAETSPEAWIEANLPAGGDARLRSVAAHVACRRAAAEGGGQGRRTPRACRGQSARRSLGGPAKRAARRGDAARGRVVRRAPRRPARPGAGRGGGGRCRRAARLGPAQPRLGVQPARGRDVAHNPAGARLRDRAARGAADPVLRAGQDRQRGRQRARRVR